MYRIPPNEDWSFLIGKELVQVRIGFFDLQLYFTDHVCVSIWGDDPKCSFEHKTNLSSSSEVQGLPGGAISLVSLLGAVVEKVVVENSVTLAIYFKNGEELRIFDSSDIYESFTINGPQGLIVV